MLTYNTQQEKLKLPEYGRNIQNMLNHCMEIEDREERNHCARTIISSMKTLFPELASGENDDVKLWDHLRIMSDFQLDVDYPVGCNLDSLALTEKPKNVPYGNQSMNYRHYGAHLETMVQKIADMEESEERDALIEDIANHMKKSLIVATLDSVDDAKVFDDLLNMSHGRIRVNPGALNLHDYKVPIQPTTGKKKKKK